MTMVKVRRGVFPGKNWPVHQRCCWCITKTVTGNSWESYNGTCLRAASGVNSLGNLWHPHQCILWETACTVTYTYFNQLSLDRLTFGEMTQHLLKKGNSLPQINHKTINCECLGFQMNWNCWWHIRHYY
jgi:hypothetical protein